jgi:hypothetical protein
MVFSSNSDWLSSGWVIAGVWVFVVLEGLFSIGIGWLVIHLARRSVERAGKLLLALDSPAGTIRHRHPLLTSSFALCIACGSLSVLIAVTSSQPLYSIPLGGLFLIVSLRNAAVLVAQRLYSPAYLEIHEHGLLYPANQPASLVTWTDIRSWAVRQYRAKGEPEYRLVIHVPGHCLNLPIGADQVSEVERLLQDRLPIGEPVSNATSFA